MCYTASVGKALRAVKCLGGNPSDLAFWQHQKVNFRANFLWMIILRSLCSVARANGTPAFIRIDGLNVELTGGKTASNSRMHCRSRQNHTKLVTPARTRGARSRIS